MANKEHLKILQSGVEAWNQWRKQNPDLRPDLKGAVLREANLSKADLREADFKEAHLFLAYLNEADLSDANLSGANLIKTYLSGADLSRADLRKADFFEADLYEADLSKADLYEADLSRTDLRGANFSGAYLLGTVLWLAIVGATTFGDVDLSEVRELDEVEHRGPSTIGIDTLARSQGKIPEVFLRGCGLSDAQIEMAKLHNPDLSQDQIIDITYKLAELLTGGAIQYYSCFISYAHQDESFAGQLHDHLQDKGVRCWFAPEDMKIGDPIRPRIDQSIRIHDKLLLILSEHSVSSRWVASEVEHAFEVEAERGQSVLFPIRVDGAIMSSQIGWAGDIKRTRHIGDFTHWKDDAAYQAAFERLLKDLQVEKAET